MKTKRTNRVAKIAMSLLIVVALFFSIGAGYQIVGNEDGIIYSVITKYNGLKVVAEAVQYERTTEEVTVAEEAIAVKAEIEEEIAEENEEEIVEEIEEQVVEEQVVEEVRTETVEPVNTAVAAIQTSAVSTASTTAVQTAAKVEEKREEVIVAEPVAAKEVVEVKPVEEEVVEEIVEEVEEVVVEAEPVVEVVEEVPAAPAIQEYSIGIPGGTMQYYTGISIDTLYNRLQATIDAGYIVKYNNYFAGHNPGAMSHLSGIGVGSVVRVSYENGEYRDYTIQAHATGSGSFADVTIGGQNLWTLVQNGGFVIQFCKGGSNNFFYGV